MLGYVEKVGDGNVSGWIYDRVGQKGCLEVLLFVNGEPAGRAEASQARADLKELGLAEGYCGFQIPFTEYNHRGLPCEISVLEARTGWMLPPGKIEFIPSRRRLDIRDIEQSIHDHIEQIVAHDELQDQLSAIARLFGHAMDRATALGRFDRDKASDFRDLIGKFDGLGGLMSHFLGVLKINYPPIVFDPTNTPKVSIVIPVFNNFNLTYACLSSIYKFRQETSFEIIVVDDLSMDETLLASLVFMGGVKIVRNERNLGFVGACNAGAAAARGEFLYFLNNDTLAQGDWLDDLCKTLDDPGIGVVGSRLLFADGKLQECGGIIWNDGSGWNWGRGQDANHPDFRYMRDADYVSGAGLMVRAKLFRDLGAFDSLYAPAYYEDTDLCFRVREAGYRVVVQPASTIVHLEGRSNGVDLNTGLKRYQVVNHAKFFSRWREVLKKHRTNGTEPQLEAQRQVKMRALFIDETVPTPDRDAGSNAAAQHILSLQRLGYHVVFVPCDNLADIPPYTADLEKLGVECVYAPYYYSVEDYFRRRKQSFDVVYIHRFANANRYLELVRHFQPDAKILYYAADLHSLREQRERELGLDNGYRSAISAEREFDLLASADAAMVCSTYELKLVKMRRPEANVHYVVWPFQTTSKSAPFGKRADFAFVGGYGHPPNVDAMIWFAQEIQPAILRLSKEPPITHMAGSNMPAKLKVLETEVLRATGYVENLETFLGARIATVAPLRYGAGIKGKVLSSWACATPCVLTPIAAEGMDLPEALRSCIAETPEAIAAALMKFATDEAAWRQASEAGLAFIRENFTRERVDAQLRATIASALPISTRGWTEPTPISTHGAGPVSAFQLKVVAGMQQPQKSV